MIFRSLRNVRRRDPAQRRTAWRAFLRRLLPPLGWLAGTTAAAALAFWGVRAGTHWVTNASAFAVAGLDVSGNDKLSADRIRAESGLQLGQNVFTVPLDQARRSLERDPWIRSVHLSRQLPNRLRIAVVERRPLALVDLGNLYVMDERGELFKRFAPDDRLDLPLITGLRRDDFIAARPELQSNLEQARVLLSLKGERGLGDMADLSEIHFDAQLGATVLYGDQPTAAHLGEGDLGPRLARLRRAQSELSRRQLRATNLYLDDAEQPDRVGVALADPTP